MKKFLTLAIMAVLLGGFAFSANAQEKSTVSNDTKNTAIVKKATSDDATEKTLKQYENAVDQCVKLFKNLNQPDSKNDRKAFDKALSTAEGLKAQLNKMQKSLDEAQLKRFNMANQKLSQVFPKG